MIRDLVAAAGFGAFVAAGLASAFLSPGERVAPVPPRRARMLVAIGVGMSLLAGLSQRELWPFATWKLMAGTASADVSTRALVCADSAGSLFGVDHRAWGPLTEEELLAWINGPYTRLTTGQQDAARAELLRKAEAARGRVRAGGSSSPAPSPLGSLAASSHLLHPRRWNRPEDAPPTPCATLRLVERRWNVDSVAAGHLTVAEQTVWEYRPPQ
jgi:hypothetical protein